MAFDKETRNLLAKTVVACRHRLTEDVIDQLLGVFGLHPDGTVLPLGKMTHLTPDQAAAARHLRDLLDHYISGAAGMEKDRPHQTRMMPQRRCLYVQNKACAD